jgi:hypothetical protein
MPVLETDSDTLRQAESQLNRAALELGGMAQSVADAKVVKEYNSDRLKRAFSEAVVDFLDAGDSAAAAEHRGRAHGAYKHQMDVLRQEYQTALRIIEKWDATKAKFEAARSVLSTERAKLGLI